MSKPFYAIATQFEIISLHNTEIEARQYIKNKLEPEQPQITYSIYEYPSDDSVLVYAMLGKEIS